MCFYYSINKKEPNSLVNKGITTKKQVGSIPNRIVANGFSRPLMPVITNTQPGSIQYFKWGFIPNTINSSKKEANFSKRYNTLNARGEGLLQSNIYKVPAQSNRCLVLASGFFEWRHIGNHKIPYYISLKDSSLFAFAGIWDQWIDECGSKNYTYSIVTTKANTLMAHIHNTKKRMPAILLPCKAKEWLQEDIENSSFDDFLKPIDSNQLTAYTIKNFHPISKEVEMDYSVITPHDYPEYLARGNKNKDEGNQLTINF